MIFSFGIVMVAAILFILFAHMKRYMSFSDAAFYIGAIMTVLMIMSFVVGVLYTSNVGVVAEMQQERQYLVDHGSEYDIKRYNDCLARFGALRSSPVWPGFLLYPSTGHLEFIDVPEKDENEQIKYRRWEGGNSTDWFDVIDLPTIEHYLEDMG